MRTFKQWLEQNNATQIINVRGARAVIVPKEQWGTKEDPTQYDADEHIIQIRSDYPYQQDPASWITHELVHYNNKTGWDGDDDHPYPTNPIERKAYTAQFKDLIQRFGYKTLDQVLQIPWIRHHTQSEKIRVFQQYFSDATASLGKE